MKRLFVLLAALAAVALFEGTSGSAASASCGLTSPAFCETFDQGPSGIRGRGGDLDPTRWSAGRLAPNASDGSTLNPVSSAPVPACRSSFARTSVYPPDDTLICDANGSVSAQLMTAIAIQYYGNNSYMIRQPFDFAGRVGKIVFDVDAHAQSLGTYVAVDITEDPVPAPTFVERENFEPGPVPRNGLMIKFIEHCNPDVSPSETMVYNNYVGAVVTPTFSVSGADCAKVREGSLNHFEILVSRTRLEVFGSDYSTDNGKTFPNLRRLYAADLDLPFTRGYVHMAGRNHASTKYGFGPDGVYHWDNIGFDGPVINDSRAYEIADNHTIGTREGAEIMNLGYLLLDGTTGRPAGIYDPVNRIDALTIENVDVSGAVSARLSLNAFALANFLHWATPEWGWAVRLNGGPWRNRFLTSAEVLAMNTIGAAGFAALLIDVPVADLRAGTNALEVLPLNLPMDYPPTIQNIDLIVSLTPGTSLRPPSNLRIVR